MQAQARGLIPLPPPSDIALPIQADGRQEWALLYNVGRRQRAGVFRVSAFYLYRRMLDCKLVVEVVAYVR